MPPEQLLKGFGKNLMSREELQRRNAAEASAVHLATFCPVTVGAPEGYTSGANEPRGVTLNAADPEDAKLLQRAAEVVASPHFPALVALAGRNVAPEVPE